MRSAVRLSANLGSALPAAPRTTPMTTTPGPGRTRAAVLRSKSISHCNMGVLSVMDALVVLSLFIILALLASLFGHDSREHPASVEEVLAHHGFTWHRERP